MKNIEFIQKSITSTIIGFHSMIDNIMNRMVYDICMQSGIKNVYTVQDLLNSNEIDKVTKAQVYAYVVHSKNGQLYNKDRSYLYHIEMAVEEYKKLCTIIGINKYSEHYINGLCASYLHDSIEDGGITYNDVKDIFGESVANIVFATTNNRGKTRKDRANDEYYALIKETDTADIVKCADRLANYNFGKSEGSSMSKKYVKEYPHFRESLYKKEMNLMWDYMDTVFS